MSKQRQGVMLAHKFKQSAICKWGAGINAPVYVQPKLNGVRCHVQWSSEQPILLSSYGNRFVSVPHIEDALRELGSQPNTRLEFDGELYNHKMSLQKISSITSLKKDLHPEYQEIGFWIFDVILPNVEQHKRKRLIEDTLTHVQHPLHLVDTVFGVVGSGMFDCGVQEIKKEGYEGYILRNPSGFYENGRSWNLLKWKFLMQGTFKVVGMSEEVSVSGVPKGSLGSFACVTPEGKKFSVGTGFTHLQRLNLWDRKYVGSTLLVEFQELTREGIPYCPVFKGLVYSSEKSSFVLPGEANA